MRSLRCLNLFNFRFHHGVCILMDLDYLSTRLWMQWMVNKLVEQGLVHHWENYLIMVVMQYQWLLLLLELLSLLNWDNYLIGCSSC